MVMFNESFINLRTLYDPMNLGTGFLALPLGSVKFFVDKYTKIIQLVLNY